MDNDMKNDTASMSAPERDVADIQEKINDFSSHWLNHRFLFPGFSAAIMGLIFLGMLVPAVEMVAWVFCGALLASFIGAMLWKDHLARQLNGAMEAAQIALKEYEKQKRRKKRKK